MVYFSTTAFLQSFCVGVFELLVCYTITLLALQLHQEHIQVVRSNRVARKHPTESNDTLAMDLGLEVISIRRYTNKGGIKHKSHAEIRNMWGWS